MDFYERVKTLAKEKGILLNDLLDSVGINYETYKSGRRLGNLPRADEAVKMAKLLGTTVEYLVNGSELTLTKKAVLDTLKDLQYMIETML